MNQAKHCEICENQLFDMKFGTKCSLTNEKPNFKNKCTYIKFDKKYEHKITDVNVEFEKIKKTKALTITNLIVFAALGISIMLIGFLIGKFALDNNVISTIPIIIMGVGFLIMPKALAPFYLYRQRMAIAKKRKLNWMKFLILIMLNTILK